jgi:hypothetical protein
MARSIERSYESKAKLPSGYTNATADATCTARTPRLLDCTVDSTVTGPGVEAFSLHNEIVGTIDPDVGRGNWRVVKEG